MAKSYCIGCGSFTHQIEYTCTECGHSLMSGCTRTGNSDSDKITFKIASVKHFRQVGETELYLTWYNHGSTRVKGGLSVADAFSLPKSHVMNMEEYNSLDINMIHKLINDLYNEQP